MKFKKITNYIAAFIFMAILVVPSVLWFAFSFNKKYDFALGENRNKASLSEIITLDNIPSELEKYYNDRIPFRSMLIRGKSIVDAYIEKPYKGIESNFLHLYSKISGYGVTERVDSKNGKIRKYMDDAVDIFRGHGLKKTEIDPYDLYVKYPMKYSDNHKVIIGQSDWLYLNDANIPLYNGTKVSKVDIPEYVKICSEFAEECEKRGKKVLFLVCPEKEEIYPEYMPFMDIKDEKERCMYVRDYIATASNINFLYPKEELLDKKNNYILYRKYDSHWNDVGAYIAYETAMRKFGYTTIPIEDVELRKTEEKAKELIPLGNMNESSFSKGVDYDVFYRMDLKVDRKELPGDPIKASFNGISNIDNNDSLFILGDSFSHSMLQFLLKDFKESYFISFKDTVDGTISDSTIKDCLDKSNVIIIEFVERNDPETMPYFCYKFTGMLKTLGD